MDLETILDYLAIGDIFEADSFKLTTPEVNINKLRVQDITPWMKQDDPVPCFQDTLKHLKLMTHSDVCDLFMVENDLIYRIPKPGPGKTFPTKWKIGKRTILAAHVAYTEKWMAFSDGIDPVKFPMGLGRVGPVYKNIFVFPIICPNSKVLGVYQFTRQKESYKMHEINICLSMTAWMATTFIQREGRKLTIENDEYISDGVRDLRCFLQSDINFEKFITSVLGRLKNKTKASTIVLYAATGSRPLQFNVFEEDCNARYERWIKNPRLIKEKEMMDLVKEAIRQNSLLIINDPANLEEKCKIGGVDITNISIQPLGNGFNTSGVILLFNKEGGFVKEDHKFIWQTGVHISTAIGFFIIKKNTDTGNEMKVIGDTFLAKILKPCIHEKLEVASFPQKAFRLQLVSFKYYPTKEDQDITLLDHTVKLFVKYFGKEFMQNSNFKNFLMSVYKAHRSVPYHNYLHAFITLHMTHLIINKNKTVFRKNETLAMLIAALCHCIDHKGYTNTFYQAHNSCLAKLYSASTHQNYSYFITNILLKDSDIWADYDSKKVKLIKDDIHSLIIQTDPEQAMETMREIKEVTLYKPLDPDVPKQRVLLKKLVIIVCEMSVFAKPFTLCFDDVIGIFEELFNEGDKYREKEKDPMEPPTMMHKRENWESIPKYVISIINKAVIPPASSLREVFPNTDPLLSSFNHSKRQWALTTLRKTDGKITYVDDRAMLSEVEGTPSDTEKEKDGGEGGEDEEREGKTTEEKGDNKKKELEGEQEQEDLKENKKDDDKEP